MYFAVLLMITASQEMRMKPFATALALSLRKAHPIALRNPSAPVERNVEPNTGNCAIPLLNALKNDKAGSNMPVLKPQGDFKMPIVTPVPVCENFGK
jgi:hypothetical protein